MKQQKLIQKLIKRDESKDLKIMKTNKPTQIFKKVQQNYNEKTQIGYFRFEF